MYNSKNDKKGRMKRPTFTSTIFSEGKITKARPSKTEKDRRPTHNAEHSLATTLANSIRQSKGAIRARVDDELSPINSSFLARLDAEDDLLTSVTQQTTAEKTIIMQSLDAMDLEWEFNDKSRSGKTTLGNRMKKLEKATRAERELIEREAEALRDLNMELDLAMRGIVCDRVTGRDVLDEYLPWSEWDPQSDGAQNAIVAGAELENHKACWTEILDSANAAALNAMKKSEEEFSIRQDKMQQSFYKILRDEEYY